MTNSSTERDLLRGALIPSLAVGVIAIIISTITQGAPGFMGALLAQLVVVMYFAVHIGVSISIIISFAPLGNHIFHQPMYL